ncbi:hypothetical protein ACI65C_010544 [Semiaphis heraclei]
MAFANSSFGRNDNDFHRELINELKMTRPTLPELNEDGPQDLDVDFGKYLVSLMKEVPKNKRKKLQTAFPILKEYIIDTKIENLESKISTLEAKPASSIESTPEDFFSEILDRQARSRNLIFFNVPELPSDSNSNDMQSILEVFRHIDTDVIPVNLLRLGKASNQCRPIRITLPNQHDVFNLLKNKSKLRQTDNFKHVSFSTDRTLLQRKHLKSILDELNLRKSAGETDIFIKYVNNMYQSSQKTAGIM